MALFPLVQGTGIEPAGGLGNQLSALTRRSYLANAYCQIYTAAPTLVCLMTNSLEESGGMDNLTVNVQYQQMVVPQYGDFTATFNAPQPIQGIQPAAWAYTMVMVPISVYLNELLIQDEQKIQDVVEIRMTDSGNAARDMLANSLFTNIVNAQQLIGLDWAIDDGTNNATFGGLTRAGNIWWQSKRYNVAAGITRQLALLYTTGITKYSGEKPDFGVMGPATWAQLAQDFVGNERYIPEEQSTNQMMSAFPALEVMGVPFYMDPYAPEGKIYMFNCNYLTMRVHRLANWEFVDFQSMVPAYQLNYVGVAVLLIQLINTKPRSCGILFGITGTATL
jgi:hypothetical protein